MPIGEGFDLPPGAEPWSDFHWFQPSTKSLLALVMLCERPVYYTGHYVSGRMAPCAGSGCDYCATGIGAQVRYAFAVADTSSRRAGLIEFGRQNGLMIRDWMVRTGSLRGMVIEVSKHSKNVQSRTEIRLIDIPCEPWFYSIDPPDVTLALYLTWNKAGFRMPQELRELAQRKLQQSKDRVEALKRDTDRGSW